MPNFWKDVLPYLVAIGGGLVGAIKWLYGALAKERDRYAKQAEQKEQVIIDKDKLIARKDLEIANLKAKIKEQQWLIDQYVKKMPDSGTSKEENNEA